MMELIPRLVLVGLALACLANAIVSGIAERPTIAAPPPWRGSAVLSSSSDVYETPTSSADEDSSLEPYSFYDTAYPVPRVSSFPAPHPQYSAIVTVRTTTWVLSRSTTITSIILETYYSTLTDTESSVEAGTVTVTTTSTECSTASGYASVYASGCSSSSISSSSSSSSVSMVTMTWSPEVTAYPLPSTEQGKSPASTSRSTTTTTTTKTTASSGKETPPVVTGGAGSAPQAAKLRTLGVVAALLAMLL
ncbi:hypothetical protein HDV63DRAFT_408319 [Trichoderma sp. SZMC 28014]